jgi:uncharacterized membrane protein
MVTMTVLELEFPTREMSRQALQAALQLQEEGRIVIHDAVMLDGAEVTASMNPTPYAAAVPSALLGALIGTLLAGPLGLLVGGIVGGGSGALTARFADTGLPQHVMVDLQRSLAPGHHGLALLVSEPSPGAAASFAMRCSTLGRSTILAC